MKLVCMCLFVRVCVCAYDVGALVVESWVYDPEDTGGHWFESQGSKAHRLCLIVH